MLSCVQRLLDIALAEEGYLEKASNSQLDSKTANAGSSNYTKYARDLDNIDGFYNGKKNGYAWCDVFVDWCFVQAFGTDTALALLCQPTGSAGAGVRYSAQYYKNKGQHHTSNPEPGDQIFFGTSHTGIVYNVDSSYVYTVEGNTSSDEGVIPNGGAVCLKKYAVGSSSISGYGRPDWSLVSGSSEITYSPSTIWNYFYARLGNSYGVAGLMGNLQAESGLYSDRVQGDIPYSDYSKEYTAKVDAGEISEYNFVHNGPGGGGYGLAQWTYSTRKQGLYDMWKSGNYTSIGSLSLALDYLWLELTTNYSGVVSTLKTATSVREASDSVLINFERPADQSESVQLARESLGIAWYNQYAGSGSGGGTVTPPVNPGHQWQGSKKKMSFLLLLASTKRNGV